MVAARLPELVKEEVHGSGSIVLRQNLEHVSILECTPTSGLHPHVGPGPLPTARAVVQILGLDELQALLNLRGFKLDKVQVACVNHAWMLGCLDACKHSACRQADDSLLNR